MNQICELICIISKIISYKKYWKKKDNINCTDLLNEIHESILIIPLQSVNSNHIDSLIYLTLMNIHNLKLLAKISSTLAYLLQVNEEKLQNNALYGILKIIDMTDIISI